MHKTLQSSTGGAKAPQKFLVDATKTPKTIDYCAVNADDRADSRSLQLVPKRRGRAAVGETFSRLSTSLSRNADIRPIQVIQQAERIGQLIADDNQNGQSDVYVSSAEGFNVDNESDDEHVLYQLCEPKTTVKKAQPSVTRCKKKTQSFQQNGKSRQIQRSSSGSARERKNSRAVTPSSSKMIETCMDSGSDSRNPKRRGRTVEKEPSRRSRTSQTEDVERRLMRAMQKKEYTDRSAVDDRHRVGFHLTSSPYTKKTIRTSDRSFSPDSDDEENEYSYRQFDSRAQSKIPSYNGDLYREFPRRSLQSADRDSSKENYVSSDDGEVKIRNRYTSRRKFNDWCDVSPNRYRTSNTCRRGPGRMKPEKFDGSTCFETFLVQFNNCA